MMQGIMESAGVPPNLLLARSMVGELQPFRATRLLRPTKEEPFSIYRVPSKIREVDDDAYDPHIISIGPYHHGKPGLQDMQHHKRRYLHDLLYRNLGGGAADEDWLRQLERCVDMVEASRERARRYYSESTTTTTDHEFARMMVLDGCFILELLMRFYWRNERKNDQIFAVGWILPLIRRDVLKLENQVPFFILEDLFAVTVQPYMEKPTLKELAFRYLMWNRVIISISIPHGRVYHLLHLYDLILLPASGEVRKSRWIIYNSKYVVTLFRSCFPLKRRGKYSTTSDRSADSSNTTTDLPLFRSGFLANKRCRFTSPPPPPPPVNPLCRPENNIIPSATQLREAGIKFKRRDAVVSFLDVTFKRGVLNIPPLPFAAATNSIFRNLIALEQCCPELGNHFTAYALFMDCLVNTSEDVVILTKCGVIENQLGSEKEVAQVLNQLCKETVITHNNHYLDGVFDEVNRYRESWLHKNTARLKRNYCNNPWTAISVLAAAVLLLLTIIQTLYSVLSYYKS